MLFMSSEFVCVELLLKSDTDHRQIFNYLNKMPPKCAVKWNSTLKSFLRNWRLSGLTTKPRVFVRQWLQLRSKIQEPKQSVFKNWKCSQHTRGGRMHIDMSMHGSTRAQWNAENWQWASLHYVCGVHRCTFRWQIMDIQKDNNSVAAAVGPGPGGWEWRRQRRRRRPAVTPHNTQAMLKTESTLEILHTVTRKVFWRFIN